MKIIAVEQEGYLRTIRPRAPLPVDLVAQAGAPFEATFHLRDDPTATNLRGQWKPWTVYEAGEVSYVTPEGPESGILSEHTPAAFALFVCSKKVQHAEPGTPPGANFWLPMAASNLGGLTAQIVFPLEEAQLNSTGTISGGDITVSLSAAQTKAAPSSRAYRLELHEGSNTTLIVARGIIVFRSLTGSR